MQIYTGILKRQLNSIGFELEEFDLTQGMEELDQFDPNVHLAGLNRRYRALDHTLQERVRHSDYDAFSQLTGIESLQSGVEQFRDQFGYLRDSDIDFSMTPWGKDPDLILNMIVNYTPAEGRSQIVGIEELSISAPRKLVFRPVYDRARRFRYFREAFGYLHKLGYGLFQPHFLALGDRFVRRGFIETCADIYYLYFDEVRSIVTKNHFEPKLRERIAQRKRDMEECLDITPPDIIYGDQAPPLECHVSDKLQGTPTSRGQYTGPVRVIQGIRDFDRLKDGDVLVIPYSDVGWTPLFTKAGAVIAESGGMLSHSSIIAREYGIPAVVSVSGACALRDDTIVAVDGFRGEIIVQDAAD
jgi:pyruvate,water dikinase